MPRTLFRKSMVSRTSVVPTCSDLLRAIAISFSCSVSQIAVARRSVSVKNEIWPHYSGNPFDCLVHGFSYGRELGGTLLLRRGQTYEYPFFTNAKSQSCQAPGSALKTGLFITPAHGRSLSTIRMASITTSRVGDSKFSHEFEKQDLQCRHKLKNKETARFSAIFY